MPKAFDLVVLGAGSGGVAAARRAAAHGAKVAVIEQGRIGGTCVLRGCVPKKLLMYAARHAPELQQARSLGWEGSATPQFSMARWAESKRKETARLEQLYAEGLTAAGIEVFHARGRLDGPGRVRAGEVVLQASHVLLATGAHADHSLIPGTASAAGSDEVLDLRSLPEHLTILGAGYIAVEFASILSGLGCRVSLRYRGELPLRGFDPDLRRRIAEMLKQQGVELHPAGLPDRVTAPAPGQAWQLHLADGAMVSSDYLMIALGRRPNTGDLGLDTVGMDLQAGAPVPVDDQLRTTAPGLYAVGDVTHRKDLTPVAIAEGRWLADRLFGTDPGPAPDLAQVPTAVFGLIPAASVGQTETDCPAGTAVYEAEFRPMRLAFSDSPERCYLKLLAAPDGGRVLGIHMHGADAPEIIQSLAVAVTEGLPKAAFDRTMALHPSTAEEFMLLRQPSRHVG